jgi:hypothetical protein
MTVVPLLLLCSLLLVAAGLVLFVWSSRQGDCHLAERLCLLPLEDDAAARRVEPDPESRLQEDRP